MLFFVKYRDKLNIICLMEEDFSVYSLFSCTIFFINELRN